MFFEDADDLGFAESGFLYGVSSRPLGSEFSSYCRSLFQAKRQHYFKQHHSPKLSKKC